MVLSASGSTKVLHFDDRQYAATAWIRWILHGSRQFGDICKSSVKLTHIFSKNFKIFLQFLDDEKFSVFLYDVDNIINRIISAPIKTYANRTKFLILFSEYCDYRKKQLKYCCLLYLFQCTYVLFGSFSVFKSTKLNIKMLWVLSM